MLAIKMYFESLRLPFRVDGLDNDGIIIAVSLVALEKIILWWTLCSYHTKKWLLAYELTSTRYYLATGGKWYLVSYIYNTRGESNTLEEMGGLFELEGREVFVFTDNIV